jgi:signal transduction histidine kinase
MLSEPTIATPAPIRAELERLDRDLLDAIADASVEGILIVDPVGRITFSNRRFAELWQLDAATLAAHDDDVALAAVRHQLVDPEGFLQRVEYLYDHPEEESRDELRLCDGRVLDRHSAPVRDGDGAVVGRAWFFRDVSEEKHREERNLFLAEASRLLSGTLDLDVAAQRLARVSADRIADWCAVDLAGEDGVFRRHGVAHVDTARERLLWDLDRRFPLIPGSGHLRGQVVRTGASLAMYHVDRRRLRSVARDPAHLAMLEQLGIESALWVPLTSLGRILGVVSLGRSAADRPFVPADLELMEEVARRAALGIDNALAYRRIRGREQQQAAVSRLGQRALSGADLATLFGEAVTAVAGTVGVELAKLLELQPGGRQMRLVAGVGWRPGLVGTALVPTVGASQAGYTLRTGQPVIVEDLSSESRFSGSESGLLQDHGVVSGMSVIVAGRGGPWGVLGAHSARRRRFDQDDLAFLQSVANVLAQAIERRRVEEERETLLAAERQANAIQETFIGVLSHELRTPITTIYGGVKVLARGRASDAQLAEILSDVEAESDRLQRLVEDLLVLARAERGSFDLGDEPVSIGKVVERVVAAAGPLPVRLTTHLPEAGLPLVVGDETYVEQVLRNLIGNSAKYAPAESTVQVIVESGSADVVVRVLDEGPGIGEDAADQVFELFYRAPETARTANGSGIGLFVCRTLVEAMGGRIWAAPRDAGGSEFGFRLPAYEEPPG